MMSLLKNTKVMGGAVVIAGLLLVAYYYWGGSSTAPTATVEQGSSPASQDLLMTLASLHSIKLDPSIFNDPLFQSLTDYGVTIPPEPTGRGNPFAPASKGAGTQSSAKTPAAPGH